MEAAEARVARAKVARALVAARLLPDADAFGIVAIGAEGACSGGPDPFRPALMAALLFGKALLGTVFNAAFRLDEEGWRKLTFRWGLFFLVLAVLNEIVWRNFSTDAWVNFKVFGLLPITLVFALANAPFMSKHMIEEEKTEAQ